jgi:hypothetical protein
VRQHHFLPSPSFSNGIAERPNQKFGRRAGNIALYSYSLDRSPMADTMVVLKSTTFTRLPAIGANSIFDRRAKFIARLEEQ